MIPTRGEQVAIEGLLPSVFSRQPQSACTTLRTWPPLITSDREYTPARSADKHLSEAHCRIIESFNGRLRDECLNQHWFLSLDEARAVTQAWREDYNRVRSHGALGNRPRMANNPAGITAGAASSRATLVIETGSIHWGRSEDDDEGSHDPNLN